MKKLSYKTAGVDIDVTSATKLIFIGGAPGVGKSTVARRLLVRLDHAVWLNGDDLWRMHPFVVNQTTTSMVEGNIQSVLGSFVAAGFSYVLFTWVLHDQSIIDRLLNGITDTPFQFSLFTLVCDEETLKSRILEPPKPIVNAGARCPQLVSDGRNCLAVSSEKNHPRTPMESRLARLRSND